MTGESVDVGKWVDELVQNAVAETPIQVAARWIADIEEWRIDATWEFKAIVYNETGPMPVTWMVRKPFTVT